MNLEQFDKVANHLIKQGKRSLALDGAGWVCAYRGEGGAKCAIGVIIPDELYGEHLEGNCFTVLNLKMRYNGDPLCEYLKPYTAPVPALVARSIKDAGWHDAAITSWGSALQVVHDHVLPAYWPALLAELRTYVEQTA